MPRVTIEYRSVIRLLVRMGFEKLPQKSTSHEQWRKIGVDGDGRPYPWKVTVDEPKSPYGDDLISFMARQAGLTRKEFIKGCCDKKYTPVSKVLR